MTYDPDTTTFNNNVQAMAETRIAAGDRIVIADQESALDYSTDMWDNLHPNNAGYDKMAVVWENALTDLLPVCTGFGPFIFTTPITETMLGYPYTYNVGALGDPAPSYSLLVGVSGMTIDPNTGEISWTPASGQEGVHDISVQAQNSEGTDTQNFQIDVSGSIVIDNGDPETSFTGFWGQSGGTNPWDPADPSATSLWSRDGDTYTWTFTPLFSGDYEFSMWWTEYASRSDNIPLFIEFAGGTDTVPINQQANGGQWNVINTYPFEAGVSYDITITSQPAPTSTCADAVRFVLVSATPPSITSQPSSQTVTVGETATFSVTATGSAPLSYQWQKDGAAISGATGATYTTPPCVTGDSGTLFHCVVSNTAGIATSNEATLTVNAAVAPSITSQPSDQSVPEGSTATFSVTATGSEPLSFQWQRGGSPIEGATAATYTTPPTTSSDDGAVFSCVVSNVKGSATSNGAILTVTPTAPSITSQPSDQSVQEGSTATFSVTATGSAPLSYQWQKDGAAISGATDATYTTPPCVTGDSGSLFRCVVSNVAGDVTSDTATLTVVVSEAPVAFNDKMDTLVGTPVIINVIANDTDSDGTIDPASVSVAAGPDNGTAVEQGDGTVLYTPNAGYSGKDTFMYTVQDDQGVESNTASVSVTVGIVIDNGDPETSFTGTWSVSGGSNPWDPADPSATSLYSRDGDTYTWTFTPDVSGNYEISMWYTYMSSRGIDIPVDIEHWGGQDTIYINQQANAGQWNSVGTYPFEAGVSYDITIIAIPGGTENYSTCADAVRFVHIPTNVTPVESIDSISPNPALPGQTVTFSGSGTDFEGAIVGYSWYSTLDGPLSDQATFSTSELSEGVHTIFFKVQDDTGAWSSEIQAAVDVNDYTVETTEHIFFAPGYATQDGMPIMISALQDMGATQSGGLWYYRNEARNKNYVIHPVDSNQEYIDALYWPDSVVLYWGHSNYGLGGLFSTAQETAAQVIEDILYVDDDRIVNTSSPVAHVNISGMRTGQAYPHWWPIYQDGTSAVMPYDWGDPSGIDPAYNYYPTYQVEGDPTHYKIETVHNSAIERFPDWGGPAWYDPSGNPPDPTN
jgi:predicted RNA-binding protein with TRAM domain